MSLLTVDDLAARWGLAPARVRKLVKHDGLPYVSFQPERPGRMSVSWRFIRFDPEAVAAWEASRQRVFLTPEPPRPRVITHRELGAF